MRVSRLLVMAAFILAAVCLPTANGGERKPKPSKARPVKIVQSWNGKLADATLRNVEPAEGFILDEKAWAKLWKAWRGAGEGASRGFSETNGAGVHRRWSQ